MYKLLRIVPTGLVSVVGLILLSYLSLASNPLDVNAVHLFKGADKVMHFLMYFCLTIGFSFDLIKKCFPCRVKLRQELMICIFAFVLSVVMEILQGCMGLGRSMDATDAIANLVGVAGGFCVLSFKLNDYFHNILKKD